MFGKRQWPSQERAESEFLTTVGRLQAAQRRIAELEADREAWRAQNAGSASGEGAGGGGSATAEEAAVQALLDPDSLDWELISGAMKERGPEVGVYLAVKQMAEKLSGNFDGRMKEALSPLAGIQQQTEAAGQAAQLWDGAVMAADEQGQLYFPELSDPQALNTVVSIWREITDGMSPEVANSPRMARMAVLEYRSMMDQSGQAQNPAEPGVDPTTAAAGAVAAQQAGAQTRGVLSPGRGRVPGAPPRRPQTEEEAIKASLMAGGQERGQLGFRR